MAIYLSQLGGNNKVSLEFCNMISIDLWEISYFLTLNNLDIFDFK